MPVFTTFDAVAAATLVARFHRALHADPLWGPALARSEPDPAAYAHRVRGYWLRVMRGRGTYVGPPLAAPPPALTARADADALQRWLHHWRTMAAALLPAALVEVLVAVAEQQLRMQVEAAGHGRLPITTPSRSLGPLHLRD